jgi:hypothetical protein
MCLITRQKETHACSNSNGPVLGTGGTGLAYIIAGCMLFHKIFILYSHVMLWIKDPDVEALASSLSSQAYFYPSSEHLGNRGSLLDKLKAVHLHVLISIRIMRCFSA